MSKIASSSSILPREEDWVGGTICVRSAASVLLLRERRTMVMLDECRFAIGSEAARFHDSAIEEY